MKFNYALVAGYDVVAVDMNASGLKTGMERIENSMKKVLSKSVKKGQLTQEAADKSFQDSWNRITPTTDLKALANCDLVIEV